MNKKGFIFIETVVVLVVVLLSLTVLLMSYNLIETKIEAKKYYDHPRDIYLLYSVGNFINTNKLDNESELNTPSTFNNCSSNFMGKMVTDCNQMYNDLGIVSIVVVNDIQELFNNQDDMLYPNYDNGAIDYLKTLPKKTSDNVPIKYLFGVFKRDASNKYYYASIPI